MTQTNDNMKLWNAVGTTDPAMTKKVNQRGGFTAICAQSQIMRATELWGPYGTDWGIRNLEYDLIRDGTGEPVLMLLKAEFFYPQGVFELGTDIAFRVGDDLRKKLLTDLTTKALSKLGFNADVFLGRFEDNKYLQEVEGEFAQRRRKAEGDKQAAKEAALALGEAKHRARTAVTEYCEQQGVNDPKHAVALIQLAVKHELNKDTVETVEEMGRVVQAILGGKYASDTGEPVPA